MEVAVDDELNRRGARVALLRNAVITFAVLFLIFAAFDDITTDNATDFTVEYAILLACTGWLLFVAGALLRTRHRVLGGVSLVAVATGLWAQRAIGPGIVPGLWPEYVAITAAYGWFLALSPTLLWLGWRTHPNGHRLSAGR
jgi:hypothetical protein